MTRCAMLAPLAAVLAAVGCYDHEFDNDPGCLGLPAAASMTIDTSSPVSVLTP